MVILRRTQKLSLLLTATNVTTASADTALGDWYVNRVVVDRKPLLLLVSSASLLPILIPARDVRSLPDRLASIVEARLKRMGIAAPVIDDEIHAMASVEVAPTVDRSVVGIMVDFAKSIPYFLVPGMSEEAALEFAEAHLAESPCYAGRPSDQVVFPKDKAPQLLRGKWRPDTAS